VLFTVDCNDVCCSKSAVVIKRVFRGGWAAVVAIQQNNCQPSRFILFYISGRLTVATSQSLAVDQGHVSAIYIKHR